MVETSELRFNLPAKRIKMLRELVRKMPEYKRKLEAERKHLAELREAWDRNDGNNPNKFRSDIENAKLSIEIYESWVKSGEEALDELIDTMILDD